MSRLHVALALTCVAVLGCAPAEPVEDAGPEVDRFAGYGEPIDVEDDEWEWEGFDDALCGDGSSTGLILSRSSRADAPVVVYFVGGGLCYDASTCFGAGLFPATVDRLSFNSADADSLLSQEGTAGLFDRDDPGNPFHDAHFMVVPYCTGDLHGGSRADAPYGVQHVGYLNVDKFLHRAVPTFPEASGVILAGSSAGGFGALLNYAQVKAGFIDLPTSLLLDSSPPFSNALIPEGFDVTTREAWGLDVAIPEGCDSCDSLYATFTYLLDQDPTLRVGLISSLQDRTLRTLIGYAGGSTISGPQYQQELLSLVDDVFAFRDNTRVYLIGGESHVFLVPGPSYGLRSGQTLGDIVVQGVAMDDWLAGFAGEGTWNNVLPQ